MSLIFHNALNTRPIFSDSFKFIRSDVPTVVTEEEVAWLIDHNITTIIDLRTEAEQKRKMCPLSRDKRFQYYCMPVAGGDTIVLYFCNPGKDRTGVVSAILLRNVGATEEYIVEDYMKSKDNLKDMRNACALQNPEIDINTITPNEKYIKDFLRWYDNQ